MKVNASKAGELTGKSKSTITRAIEKERMTATKNDVGEWEIDTSELDRVFGILPQDEQEKKKTQPSPPPSNAMEYEIKNLKTLLEVADEKLEKEVTERERERKEWERNRDEAQKQIDAMHEALRKAQDVQYRLTYEPQRAAQSPAPTDEDVNPVGQKSAPAPSKTDKLEPRPFRWWQKALFKKAS